MSGDATYQSLKRLSYIPDRPTEYDGGTVIAGQEYFDVFFAGGSASNMAVSDSSISNATISNSSFTGGTITNLTSPLAINSGGTGQITANAALNALLPSQAGNAGKFLKTDGTNTSWSVDTDTGITQLTGDVTAGPGSGSQAATLATVNSNIGSFGTATQVGSFTVNAKGLVTAASNTSIQIAQSQVTNLVTDLSNKQPLDSTLTALAAYNTNGILTQTAANTFTGRTITGTANRIVVTNGNGVSGNPTLDIGSNVLTTSNIGTSIGSIVRLENVGGVAGLPAVGGSQLTSLPNGTTVNRGYAEYTSAASISAVILPDDSPPLVSEGTEILSVTITPKTTTNRFRLRFGGFGACSTTGNILTVALFAGSTLVNVTAAEQVSGQDISQMYCEGEIVGGTVSPITFTVRAGPNANSAYFNANFTGTRFYGGSSKATLVVEEIQA